MKLVLTAVAAITIFPTLFAKAESTDSRSVLDSVAIRCELAYQYEQEKYSSQRMLDRRKSEFEKQKEVLTRLKNAERDSGEHESSTAGKSRSTAGKETG